MRPWLMLILVLSLASPALASDGVLEINQTCAVQTGCFAGDSAGFPVTISASGSYGFTSNLSVPTGIDGIWIQADHTSVDLHGFAILGPSVCTGNSGGAITCTVVGAAVGIYIGADDVSITDGTIRGMPGQGIDAFAAGGATFDGIRIDRMRLVSNGGIGIRYGRRMVVEHSLFLLNRGGGIEANIDSVVTANIAAVNGDEGISTAGQSVISENVSVLSGTADIAAGVASVASHNVVRGGAVGLAQSVGGLDGGLLRGNMSSEHATAGLSSLGLSGFGENVMIGEPAPVTGGGINMGGNLCGTGVLCP